MVSSEEYASYYVQDLWDARDCRGDYSPDVSDDVYGMARYIEDSVLEYRYITNREGDYLGAQLLLGYGGPTVWVDTGLQTICVFQVGDDYYGALDYALCTSIDSYFEDWFCNF